MAPALNRYEHDSLTHQATGSDEWLETNGLGQFASGTVPGWRTRRYHALLMAATDRERFVLLNGIEAWLDADGRKIPVSTHRYQSGVDYPEISDVAVSFDSSHWPSWTHSFPKGLKLRQDGFMPYGTNSVVVSWTAEADPIGHLADAASIGTDLSPSAVRLRVRPLISGRTYHGLMRENSEFQFQAEADGQRVTWKPYLDVTAIGVLNNSTYTHAPDWYRYCSYRNNTVTNSEHVGGRQVMLGDDSVRFMSENTDFTLLKLVCAKRDGQVVVEC